MLDEITEKLLHGLCAEHYCTKLLNLICRKKSNDSGTELILPSCLRQADHFVRTAKRIQMKCIRMVDVDIFRQS